MGANIASALAAASNLNNFIDEVPAESKWGAPEGTPHC